VGEKSMTNLLLGTWRNWLLSRGWIAVYHKDKGIYTKFKKEKSSWLLLNQAIRTEQAEELKREEESIMDKTAKENWLLGHGWKYYTSRDGNVMGEDPHGHYQPENEALQCATGITMCNCADRMNDLTERIQKTEEMRDSWRNSYKQAIKTLQESKAKQYELETELDKARAYQYRSSKTETFEKTITLLKKDLLTNEKKHQALLNRYTRQCRELRNKDNAFKTLTLINEKLRNDVDEQAEQMNELKSFNVWCTSTSNNIISAAAFALWQEAARQYNKVNCILSVQENIEIIKKTVDTFLRIKDVR